MISLHAPRESETHNIKLTSYASLNLRGQISLHALRESETHNIKLTSYASLNLRGQRYARLKTN